MLFKSFLSTVLFAVAVSASVIHIEIDGEAVFTDSQSSASSRKQSVLDNYCGIIGDSCDRNDLCCPGLSCDLDNYECRFKSNKIAAAAYNALRKHHDHNQLDSSLFCAERGLYCQSDDDCCKPFRCENNGYGGQCN